MKRIHSILLLVTVIAIAGLYTACNKTDAPNGGEPRIRYVRVTNPASSDSLLVGAGQGKLIAIMGENLQHTVAIWFNDQKASLTPTYITNTSILATVPAQIPTVIDNKLKLYFSNGDSLLYDFEVEISEPLVNSMVSEYVGEGEVATIRGDYFYEPLSVTFAGGVQGELESVEDQIIKVRVPAGAEPGQITITTNFGETKSNFWFRDNRNIVLSSDPFTGWWNSSFVVSDPGPTDPPKINGNYIRVNKAIGSWAWTEAAGGPPDAMGAISKNIPDAAILRPQDYNLKFEVNTRKPYNNNMIKFNFGLAADFNNDHYKWAPPIDTHGEWQTIIIPFNEIADSYGGNLAINPAGYYTRILFHGGGDLDADISFDNFRIVPKVIE